MYIKISSSVRLYKLNRGYGARPGGYQRENLEATSATWRLPTLEVLPRARLDVAWIFINQPLTRHLTQRNKHSIFDAFLPP